jgi:hypothetical protein
MRLELNRITMFVTFKPEDPFALEDFLASWDRGAGDKLVDIHVMKAGELLFNTCSPRCAIRGVESLREGDRVS